MFNWEITAGRQDLLWHSKETHYWWVMGWDTDFFNKGHKAYHTPLPVWAMEGTGILMLFYAPEYAIQFGNSLNRAGKAGDKMFYISPKDIWARMPMIVPEKPNVEMFFNKNPFEEIDV